MIHADIWYTAQEPRYVDGPAHAPTRVSLHVKHQEARDLAAAVEAHRLAGGAYAVLDGTPTPAAPRRRLAE